MVFITKEALNKRLNDCYKDGKNAGEINSKLRVEELEKQINKKNRELVRLERSHEEYKEDTGASIKRLETKLEVLEAERDDVRDQVKLEMENEDKKALLEAREDGLDEREAAIKDREAQLLKKEDAKKTADYADGLADGLRKAHEITEKDRENAMKIAMVSAASHTPVENMKEVNNALQITEGSADKKTK